MYTKKSGLVPYVLLFLMRLAYSMHLRWSRAATAGRIEPLPKLRACGVSYLPAFAGKSGSDRITTELSRSSRQVTCAINRV